MNIAIIIGVSVYSDSRNNLPGCKNDAEVIQNIIQKTTKFDEILYLNNNEPSAIIKEDITNFVSKHRGKQVEELFLYYSGHGQFLNDEFYYILSDFDAKKRNQTSLQNSEMDDLLRTLTPNLVIKVIDACQSGTTYIKEDNIVMKYFDASKKGFSKCYFLNSSLNNQSSFQTNSISFFTYSFISALTRHKSEGIRYKDIIDVISDEFQDNREQTPFFIIQADLTEKFCSFSTELRDYLKTISTNKIYSAESKASSLSIFEKAKIDAENYTDKEGAIAAIELLKEKFNSIKLQSELRELYKVTLNYLEKLEEVPQKSTIAKWLKENKREYFATPIYVQEYDSDIGETFDVLKDFELGVDAPFKGITIEVLGNFPNLTSYHCTVIYLLSKRFIRFFYFISNYIDKSWDIKQLNYRGIQWITEECSIKNEDEILRQVEKIFESIQNKIVVELNERFGEEDKTEEDQTDVDTP